MNYLTRLLVILAGIAFGLCSCVASPTPSSPALSYAEQVRQARLRAGIPETEEEPEFLQPMVTPHMVNLGHPPGCPCMTGFVNLPWASKQPPSPVPGIPGNEARDQR